MTTTLLVFGCVALGCAVLPALLFLWNSFLFREPPSFLETADILPTGSREVSPSGPGAGRIGPEAAGKVPAVPGERTSVSVLIPARNEELGIAECVRSILASQHIEVEVIVLDDGSTDRTAQIVRAIATKDPRVQLQQAPPLPDGWSGKQHACFALSKLAKYETLTFLDADVRLHTDALARMALFLRASGCDLVSGFPKQETGTLLEKLLIPLINWLLLCWLPLWGMRHFRWSAFGAGCGQWFMTSRVSYEKVGGHAAVKASFHDGLTLPRAYRKAGFWTDVCDATELATCRMYRSASGVWFGLAKNAREGMAATEQIGFWTFVLLFGQVLPLPLLVASIFVFDTALELSAPCLALWCARYPRSAVQRRFRTAPVWWPLHSVAVLLLLAVQWYAVLCWLAGRPIGWKGRARPAAAP